MSRNNGFLILNDLKDFVIDDLQYGKVISDGCYARHCEIGYRKKRVYLRTPNLQIRSISQFEGADYLCFCPGEDLCRIVQQVDEKNVFQVFDNFSNWFDFGEEEPPIEFLWDNLCPALKPGGSNGRDPQMVFRLTEEPEIYDQENRELCLGDVRPSMCFRALLQPYKLEWDIEQGILRTVWKVAQIKVQAPNADERPSDCLLNSESEGEEEFS
ncbi:MAG: hypothetical protein ACYCOU_01410 [Sulfobacillus sp.]